MQRVQLQRNIQARKKENISNTAAGAEALL